MSDNERIHPAVSPEDWKELTDDEEYGLTFRSRLRDAIYECDVTGNLTRHGLAALALYGQHFGFTRADLTFLRDAAADLRKFDVPGWPLYAEQFASLADRIAALLPPEATRR